MLIKNLNTTIALIQSPISHRTFIVSFEKKKFAGSWRLAKILALRSIGFGRNKEEISFEFRGKFSLYNFL